MDLKANYGYGLRTGPSAVVGTLFSGNLNGNLDNICSQCHRNKTTASARECSQVHSRHLNSRGKDCAACHKGEAIKGPTISSLKEAYHKQCFSCHTKESGQEPYSCTGCHSKKAQQ